MPAGAVRDFIPDGETITGPERQRMTLARGSAGRPDFIPGDGHTKAEPSGRDAQFKDALDRAMAQQEHALSREYHTAVERIAPLNVVQTVDLIGTAPYSAMELFLAVEVLNGNREDVLSHFPPVDPKVVERYRPFAVSAASPAPVATKKATRSGRNVSDTSSPKPEDASASDGSGEAR